MSRIMVIGAGPLLQDDTRFFSGQCLRTLQFVEPLRQAGHGVELFTVPIFVEPEERDRPPLTADCYGDFAYSRFHTSDETPLLALLQDAVDRIGPDAIVGVNPYPAHLAGSLRTAAPIWCDMNGYAPIEGQTRARLVGDDACLGHFLRHEKTALRRGDRFSTVSARQKYALLGELALMGRLNRFTFDYNFATVTPNAAAPHYLDLGARRPHPSPDPDAPFRVLWAGGYNTWTDVDALFAGLAAAMDRDRRIQYISTGGAVRGHDDVTYGRFCDRVARSPLARRFDLRGWVEGRQVDELLRTCDLGINLDAHNYETLFGARNRLTTMLASALPVLTTRGTEIAEAIETAGVGRCIPPGDGTALGEALLAAASDRPALRAMGLRGRAFALERYGAETTVVDLLDWACAPTLAPDNQQKVSVGPDDDRPLWLRPLNAAEVEMAPLEALPMETLLCDSRDLALLRSRPAYRLARALKRLLRGGTRRTGEK